MKRLPSTSSMMAPSAFAANTGTAAETPRATNSWRRACNARDRVPGIFNCGVPSDISSLLIGKIVNIRRGSYNLPLKVILFQFYHTLHSSLLGDCNQDLL